VKSLVVFVLLAFGFVARADILFLDLNNAADEIAAAERAALARGERLIVIPTVDAQTRRVQDEASKRADQIAERIHKDCGPSSANPACPGLRNDFERASDELRRLTEANRITPDKIKGELKRLEKDGTRLSSVVISGHDGNGKFSGAYGAMSADALEEAFKETPKLNENVRSVLLWGCYTTTLGSIDGHWKGIFPNVGVFAGFDGRGPNKYRVANHTYLEDFLKSDKAFMSARDKNQVMSIARGIRGFNNTASAICVNDLIVTPSGVRDLLALRADCALDSRNRELLKEYECYLQAREQRCANPPANTDTGPLRELYTYLQQKTQCRAYWAELRQEIDIPEPQDVQMLLFFNNVKLNLATLHRADLARIDQALREVGAPANLKVSDLSQLSRAELLDRLGAIEAFLDRSDLQGVNHPKAVTLDYLRGAVGEVDDIVSTMQKTPDGWYDPSTNPSLFLQKAVEDQTKGEIRVTHEAIRLERKYESIKKQLTARHPDAERLSAATRKYNEALESHDARALQTAVVELGRVKKKIEADVGRDLAARVETDLQSRGSSENERLAYQKFLEKLRR
jgi:hypothetical protein